jgi:hypothetical protein
MNRGQSFGFRTAGIILGGLIGFVFFRDDKFLSIDVYLLLGTAGFVIGELISRKWER